eukprot:11192361-Lingulodinium_polyedra.AAC.1
MRLGALALVAQEFPAPELTPLRWTPKHTAPDRASLWQTAIDDRRANAHNRSHYHAQSSFDLTLPRSFAAG